MPCPARLKSEVVEMKKSKAILSLICAILCVCTVLCSCSGGGNNATTSAGTTAPAAETTAAYTVANGAHSKIGSGKFSFVLEVIDGNGGSTVFDVASDKSTVGEALSSIGLISGEQGDYGLYVKTVNGITADYDKDQTYWSFYIDGEYAQTGVDMTAVNDGSTYKLAIETMAQ